ncbi:acyl-CoA thioesterase [Sphingobium chungbukense]|uniref:acyl-CoA thioesterase n=1 Tax=Sphingobium chungbukense TaxID=56193 RepID=UPI0038CDBD2D
MESMSFLRSVKVGDEASVYAGIVKTRRSSMQISVEAWRRPRWSEKEEKVTKAIFTFVAIGPNGRPRALGAASQTVDASRQTVSRLSRADVTGKWRWREHKRRILRNGAKRL